MIVVLHYGSEFLTRACLDAVASTTDEPVTVVDNGGDWPHTDWRTIRPGRNLGFAAGCNLGAADCHDPRVCFLNNDTVPEPGWWEQMTAVDADVVGATLYRPNGDLQHRRVEVDFSQPWGLEAQERTDRGPVHAVTGAALLIRTETFRTVGGFDEGFWNGYEDVDLCLKVSDLGGTIATSDARIMHHVSAGGPERWRMVRHNIDRLRAKWEGSWP